MEMQCNANPVHIDAVHAIPMKTAHYAQQQGNITSNTD